MSGREQQEQRQRLPEFTLPFISPGGGELSGIVPGRLPIWVCWSRFSALSAVSLGHAASVLGLQFSLEEVTLPLACEKRTVW